MDLRRKAQRWVSVICCTVLLLSAVQVPARRDAAAAQPATSEQSGQRLAYIGSDHNLWLMSADGSGRTALTQDGLVSRFAWAPDGHSLAVVRRLNSATDPERKTDVALLGLASSTETLLLDDLAAGIWSVAWTHDGTRLALLTYNWPDGSARVLQVDTETGDMAILDSWQPVGMGVGFPFITSGVAWSPDGRSLLVYGYPSRIEVLTVDGGAVTDKVFLAGSNSTGSLQEARCLCPRWSPDGSLIACHDFDAILVVTPDGNLLHELPVSEPSWQSPVWSPDGIKIATGGRDGLWVIDTQGGERTHLVTREAWEPSWSPDGQYLAFSLVEGLGGEYHELQGIGVIGVDGQGLQVYDVGSYLALWQPVQAPLEPVCGTWSGSVSDERIELTRVSESSGDECRGAFLFSNGSGFWDLGGYTLELEVRHLENANAEWITLLYSAEGMESVFLLPSLAMELHTFPVDVRMDAQVSVKGEMTLESVTRDTALFLLKTALTLAPGGSCLVPEEQLAYVAVGLSYILAPAVQLAWAGELAAAWEELQQLLPEFLDQCVAGLKEAGIDCAAEVLKDFIGKPVVILKLIWEYLSWFGVVVDDYWQYQGRPVYATLVYEVPVVAGQSGPGRIVFVSHRDDNYGELYVMDGDGQNQKRLTNTPGVTEWHPAWSPDGSRIVFQCELSGAASFNVCLINPDGSRYTRITNWEQDGSGAQRPVWSPDGDEIAVSREMGDGDPTWIWLMNADGSNQRQLIEGRDPSWSPDGTRIAFEGQVNGGYPQLFTVNTDGSDLRQLTELPNFVMYPAWSPDGRQIAFEVGMTYVAVIDADGGPVRTVVDKRSWNLSWSPDGTQLALAPVQDGIWVVNLDGSGLHQIAQEGTQPSWHH